MGARGHAHRQSLLVVSECVELGICIVVCVASCIAVSASFAGLVAA
jgi:hypothetical protein